MCKTCETQGQNQEDTSSGSRKKAARMSFPDYRRKEMKGDQMDKEGLAWKQAIKQTAMMYISC